MPKLTETVSARYRHALEDGRLQWDLCPRHCRLRDGQRAVCFVRERRGDGIVLTSYGRSSGFCIDPIEKKPLFHFLPGSPVFSLGTAGCNLACKFCQNWDISKAREFHVLAARATPDLPRMHPPNLLPPRGGESGLLPISRSAKRPADDPHAHDACDVMARLGPTVMRPPR